jgi:hypothetical protein
MPLFREPKTCQGQEGLDHQKHFSGAKENRGISNKNLPKSVCARLLFSR